MNNQHKILDWFDNHIDIVEEISAKYYCEYLGSKGNWDRVFDDMLRTEYHDMFSDYIAEECSFKLGLPQDECNTILEDKLNKMWEIALKGRDA